MYRQPKRGAYVCRKLRSATSVRTRWATADIQRQTERRSIRSVGGRTQHDIEAAQLSRLHMHASAVCMSISLQIRGDERMKPLLCMVCQRPYISDVHVPAGCTHACLRCRIG